MYSSASSGLSIDQFNVSGDQSRNGQTTQIPTQSSDGQEGLSEQLKGKAFQKM